MWGKCCYSLNFIDTLFVKFLKIRNYECFCRVKEDSRTEYVKKFKMIWPQCIFSVAKKGMSYGGSNGGVSTLFL